VSVFVQSVIQSRYLPGNIYFLTMTPLLLSVVNSNVSKTRYLTAQFTPGGTKKVYCVKNICEVTSSIDIDVDNIIIRKLIILFSEYDGNRKNHIEGLVKQRGFF
jgi:hypothetical protein